MKRVEKIWAELSQSKKKTKLSARSKRNVKLSVVDEAEKAYEYLERISSELSYFAYEMIDEMEEKVIDAIEGLDEMLVNSEMTNVVEEAKNASEILSKIKESADDLGIDVEDVFSDYENLKYLVDNAEDLAYDALANFERSLLKDLTGFGNRLKQ